MGIGDYENGVVWRWERSGQREWMSKHSKLMAGDTPAGSLAAAYNTRRQHAKHAWCSQVQAGWHKSGKPAKGALRQGMSILASSSAAPQKPKQPKRLTPERRAAACSSSAWQCFNCSRRLAASRRLSSSCCSSGRRKLSAGRSGRTRLAAKRLSGVTRARFGSALRALLTPAAGWYSRQPGEHASQLSMPGWEAGCTAVSGC